MPKKRSDYDLVPMDEVFARRQNDPEYRKVLESVKPEFDRLRRQIRRRRARRLMREAVVKRVRSFWTGFMRGISRIA